jgi:hypothetical protein
MKTYTEQQAKALRPQIFSYVGRTTTWNIKAYLKENAISYLRNKTGEELSDGDVHAINEINSHQSPVDEIICEFAGYENGLPMDEYTIRMAQ